MPFASLCCCHPAGRHAGGKLGHRLVVVSALVELFGGSCIVLMVIWTQLELLLPAAGEAAAWWCRHAGSLRRLASGSCYFVLVSRVPSHPASSSFFSPFLLR